MYIYSSQSRKMSYTLWGYNKNFTISFVKKETEYFKNFSN